MKATNNLDGIMGTLCSKFESERSQYLSNKVEREYTYPRIIKMFCESGA